MHSAWGFFPLQKPEACAQDQGCHWPMLLSQEVQKGVNVSAYNGLLAYACIVVVLAWSAQLLLSKLWLSAILFV